MESTQMGTQSETLETLASRLQSIELEMEASDRESVPAIGLIGEVVSNEYVRRLFELYRGVAVACTLGGAELEDACARLEGDIDALAREIGILD
jgi:hypothetical protein